MIVCFYYVSNLQLINFLYYSDNIIQHITLIRPVICALYTTFHFYSCRTILLNIYLFIDSIFLIFPQWTVFKNEITFVCIDIEFFSITLFTLINHFKKVLNTFIMSDNINQEINSLKYEINEYITSNATINNMVWVADMSENIRWTCPDRPIRQQFTRTAIILIYSIQFWKLRK